MNIKRIGRAAICLLMVCALLVNVSPIRAEANAAGLLGSIAGVTSVNVPAGLVYGAAAIALGVAAGSNDDFRNMVDTAVTAGAEWVKDGTVELLRVVDATGKAVYYAGADFLESIRSWLIDTRFVYEATPFYHGTLSAGGRLPYPFLNPTTYVRINGDVKYLLTKQKTSDDGAKRKWKVNILSYSTEYFSYDFCYLSNDNRYSGGTASKSGNYYYYDYSGGYSYNIGSTQLSQYEANIAGYLDITGMGLDTSHQILEYALNLGDVSTLVSDYDVVLGSFSKSPVDGSSALDWASEYQANRLYVTGGSNDPDPPDENNGKWFWPLALTLTAAELYAMSQADEWSGETPQEFDDYTQNTEYEIISRPEFDGYTGIEISPKPEQNPDAGENPDIGGDTGTDEDAETTWFQRIVKGIEELPSKFGSWFDKILEWLEKIWEAIITLPETIADWISDVLQWAFAPSETFIQSKVEALISKYPTADTFSNLGKSLNAFFGGLGATPPIIYIDLGAFEGSYLLGGREVFLDLTWYSRYKPTVDSIIGAFIWLWLAWRVFLSIPSIIHGEAGSWGDRKTDIGASNTFGATIVHQRELSSGKK